jgi:hypothetical protein
MDPSPAKKRRLKTRLGEDQDDMMIGEQTFYGILRLSVGD